MMAETSVQPHSLDNKMQQLIARLVDYELLASDATFDAASFHEFKRFVASKVHVSSTTISKVMERLLFSISSTQTIQHIVVLGSYCGYAMLWMAAGLQSKPDAVIDGFDINEQACELARLNMERSRLQQAHIFNKDAYTATENYEDGSIDLLFIDVEHHGKSDYAPLLQQWLPKLSKGAIVLAHDPLIAKFQQDFAAYHQVVTNKALFTKTLTLPIDECGVEISIRP
ncbi:O-methyltransferase [Paenibacillus campi]|uniref:O-methyltransferase n=1 Tax=Paenibacillus campi TaxID=3106031 RepID=UPI002AFFC7E9|nr:class I SAM-dependent methyltransferase [Paenibacillus sp. SGZ-1014]